MNAAEKLTKARAGLILDAPFFGALALRLRVLPDDTCKTAWTDGTTLGYSPAFVDALTLAECKALLAHEVMHCALAHHTRRGARDAKRWNVAADYAENALLREAGFTLPNGCLLNSAFAGRSAEEVYGLLPAPDPGDDNGDDGNGSDPGAMGEVRDAPGGNGNGPASPSELAQAEQEWKVATVQAAQAAKAAGRLPGGIARLVSAIVAPRVDWHQALRRFVDQTARNDYSWNRPSRRFAAQGLYLPAPHSEELGPVVVAVDTSGSVDEATLNQFAAEVSGILEEYKTTAHVIYCDTHVSSVEVFTAEDLPLQLKPQGGGGTDFRPPFERVERDTLEPSCFVYLTDLEGYSFPDEPPYPVLWARIGKGGAVPPFGETLDVD